MCFQKHLLTSKMVELKIFSLKEVTLLFIRLVFNVGVSLLQSINCKLSFFKQSLRKCQDNPTFLVLLRWPHYKWHQLLILSAQKRFCRFVSLTERGFLNIYYIFWIKIGFRFFFSMVKYFLGNNICNIYFSG